MLAVATANAPHRWKQQDVVERFAQHFPTYGEAAAERIFRNSAIEYRNFVLSPEEFDPNADADSLHAIFGEHSVSLGSDAARRCLTKSAVAVEDIDCLIVATCTGYLCPGLTAHLARELGLRDDIQRADLVGMGCSGAMPSLQRACDFAQANPGKRALVVTVEISSACWFVDDTMETIVGNAICGDGAAAVVVEASEDGPGMVINRFSALMDTSYIESVGFEFKAGKNRIILAKELRDAAGPLVKRAVERLLEQVQSDRGDIRHWVIHSGGKRVLDSIDESLEFANGELANSRSVLRECGNMSSPTLFYVLERAMQGAEPGERGILVALGPGLSAETAFVSW
ncbi:MAG: type III polyketide synthase [Verrucomicrobiota bacterium]